MAQSDHDRSSALSDACVDRGVAAAVWLGGIRSDELAGGGRSPYPHRDRSGLRGCSADAWDVSRAGGQRADRRRACDSKRRHAGLDQELPVPEDWSILVEKATQLPEQLPPPTRQQQMAQQQ